jgi:hypothetical protein
MLVCMRTTINLPNDLGGAARAYASEHGETFTSVVEQALRELLARHVARPAAPPVPTFSGGGAGLLVDIDDREALWAALDADGAA